MSQPLVLCTALSLFVAGNASALTMTPLSDNRSTQANASADFQSDSDSETPGPGFPAFVSESFAQAPGPFVDDELAGDALNGGSYAQANARQSSGLGALSISGSGSVDASGSHGLIEARLLGDAGGAPDLFSADATSILDIVFSIDEDAKFDLDGFLTAGEELLIRGLIGNDVINRASVLLASVDTEQTIFEREISNSSQLIDESGVLSAGTYIFRATAYAEVYGGDVINPSFAGDAGERPLGYATSAGFEEVILSLSAIDKPIPEPVTTSLIGMGLGALLFGTARRRA